MNRPIPRCSGRRWRCSWQGASPTRPAPFPIPNTFRWDEKLSRLSQRKQGGKINSFRQFLPTPCPTTTACVPRYLFPSAGRPRAREEGCLLAHDSHVLHKDTVRQALVSGQLQHLQPQLGLQHADQELVLPLGAREVHLLALLSPQCVLAQRLGQSPHNSVGASPEARDAAAQPCHVARGTVRGRRAAVAGAGGTTARLFVWLRALSSTLTGAAAAKRLPPPVPSE